jgi:hypothetical protein
MIWARDAVVRTFSTFWSANPDWMYWVDFGCNILDGISLSTHPGRHNPVGIFWHILVFFLDQHTVVGSSSFYW